MASLFTDGKFQAFDADGNPLASGKLYSYAAGTLTPLATYTTQAGNVANANPVILDSAGRASVWRGAGSYRMILKSAADVTVWDVDNIANEAGDLADTADSANGDALIGVKSALTGATARTQHGKNADCVSALDFGADNTGAADSTAAIQYALNTGKQVFLPAGTYKISTLTFTANGQGLIGESPTSTILSSTVSGVAAAAIKSDDQTTTRLFCYVKNVQVVASSLAVGYVLDWKSIQFGRIENVWVYGGGAGCTGIRLDANWVTTECTYNSISDCYIGNIGKGISFGDGANTNTLTGNRIQPLATGYAYFLAGTAAARVSNNTIVGGGCEYAGAVSRGVYAGLGVDVLTITGVRFEFLAVAIETTVDAAGVYLFGNYYDSNTNDYAIASTKTIRVEKQGVEFPNAAATSTTALDYYQRGTFTPTVKGGTIAGAGTYTLQSGSYTRIGDRVLFECQVTWTAHTGTGNLLLDGLPFTIKSQSHNHPLAIAADNLTFSGQIACIALANSTMAGVYSLATGAAASAVAMDGTGSLYVSGSFAV